MLADPERQPLAFRCRRGEDRTSVLPALLLALLVVGDDDYPLSDTACARLCADRGQDPGQRTCEATVPALWGHHRWSEHPTPAAQVEPCYLNVATALAGVDGTFEDVVKLTVYVVD
jgi:Tyrosine phosphatase family